ncbi:MAG: hypothetical protein QOE97_2671 [Pseudonocardiales bacterium]|nr:hypothetical protein [Pseudonocardiales bacterium]
MRPRRQDGAPERPLTSPMTAILVVAILGVFEPQIKDAISSALDSVTSSQ